MKQSLTPEIATFLRVVELGSFAAVAEETGFTASGVSRVVSRLEDRLRVKLLQRSTRSLVLTPEGEAFLGYARDMLALAEAAEAEVSSTLGRPRGELRINSGTAFANHKLSPLLPRLLERYPEIALDVSVSDQRIDPIAAQNDVTIRVGPLNDSDLIAVRIGTVRRVIAASPDYLAKHGKPETAQELTQHNCLLLRGFSRQAVWPMYQDARRIDLAVSGSVRSDSAESLLRMAIAGAGIIRLGDFLGADALADGRLVSLLEGHHDPDPQPITALVAPGRQKIPRVRAFIDFLRAEL
ncbi:LysR family transcriptional regulator [Denitrobaculum tricleocarpae]|uniref:LysR family transcriptional regulator n=1 Tax=Denitrobaculum tricleocarpae TaxID=2591009 RepID=A0A545TQ36_9PROT|nr:LysR family transcriptional regulator [Denitrobaculum tricleocarpae]TQV79241.1 LysR family transcriptional regulator [Denitrobaculum tricleocarpae]